MVSEAICGNYVLDLAELVMRKARLSPRGLEIFPMQGGEEPAFHAPLIAKLMALIAPSIKRLLREVVSIGLNCG